MLGKTWRIFRCETFSYFKIFNYWHRILVISQKWKFCHHCGCNYQLQFPREEFQILRNQNIFPTVKAVFHKYLMNTTSRSTDSNLKCKLQRAQYLIQFWLEVSTNITFDNIWVLLLTKFTHCYFCNLKLFPEKKKTIIILDSFNKLDFQI